MSGGSSRQKMRSGGKTSWALARKRERERFYRWKRHEEQARALVAARPSARPRIKWIKPRTFEDRERLSRMLVELDYRYVKVCGDKSDPMYAFRKRQQARASYRANALTGRPIKASDREVPFAHIHRRAFTGFWPFHHLTPEFVRFLSRSSDPAILRRVERQLEQEELASEAAALTQVEFCAVVRIRCPERFDDITPAQAGGPRSPTASTGTTL